MKTRAVLTCCALIFLLAFGVAFAQGNFPEVIEFDGVADGGGSKEIHPSTYTGPVKFQHRKHQVDYKLKCSDCHHDSDAVKIMGSGSTKSLRCITCHKKEGLVRGAIAENAISDDELIAHRANALHLLCRGCHKKYNATVHVVQAPEACRICHTKRPQDWVLE
jgi:hypothetical protein